MNDTATCPDSGGAGGSRSQVLVGNAIKDACEKLIAAMSKDGGGYRTYDEMVAEGLDLRYEGSWTQTTGVIVDPKTGQGAPIANYMYSVFLAEVSVEVATGKAYVDHLLICTDVGVINSRLNVDGQMWGSLSQGIGLALTEDFEDLKKHTSMRACGIPYPKDVTDDLTVLYLETPRPLGPYGASGCGEAPLTAPHTAIINAIDNACGARVRHLPALPEKVLEVDEARTSRPFRKQLIAPAAVAAGAAVGRRRLCTDAGRLALAKDAGWTRRGCFSSRSSASRTSRLLATRHAPCTSTRGRCWPRRAGATGPRPAGTSSSRCRSRT